MNGCPACDFIGPVPEWQDLNLEIHRIEHYIRNTYLAPAMARALDKMERR